MNENQIKAKIRVCVKKYAPYLKQHALAAYAKQGRGHLMFFCKVPREFESKFKKHSACYISQDQEAKNVKLQPKSRDEELEKMVREYDPETQAVVIAFFGSPYLKVRLRFDKPMTDAEWAEVTVLRGTH